MGNKRDSLGKRVLFFITYLILIIAVFGIFELGLRIFHYGIDTDPFTRVTVNGEEYCTDNTEFVNKYYPGARKEYESDERNFFPVKKQPGTLRGFVIGGSTAQGFPYRSNQSFGAFTGQALMMTGKYSRVDMINLGNSAMTSYYVADVAKKILKYKPDFVIIYTGHNELYGTVSWTTGGSHLQKKIYLALREFRTAQLIYETLEHFKKSDAAVHDTLMGRQFANTMIARDDQRDKEIAARFIQNLTESVALFDRHKIPVIVVEPVANLYDMPPFAGEGDLDAAAFIAGYNAAIEARDAFKVADFYNRSKSLELYRKNACVHYLNGRAALLMHNDLASAVVEFNAAKDLDTVPFRARNVIVQSLGQFYGENNQKYTHMSYIPLNDILAGFGNIEYFGNKIFADHLHFNIEGNRLVAYYCAIAAASALGIDKDAAGVLFNKNIPEFNRIMDISDIDGFNAFMSIFNLVGKPPYSDMKIPYQVEPLIDMDNAIVADQALYAKVRALSGKAAYLEAGYYYLAHENVAAAQQVGRSLLHNYPGFGGAHYFMAQVAAAGNDLTTAKYEIAFAYVLSNRSQQVFAKAQKMLDEEELVKLEKEYGKPFKK